MKLTSLQQSNTVSAKLDYSEYSDSSVNVGNDSLTIDDLASVARDGKQVRLTENPDILQGIQASCDFINDAVESGKPIYGVTSGFDGMADVVISPEEASELQTNLVWFLKSGAGKKLPISDVRAAMLLRAKLRSSLIRNN